jgi:hypothetical protein
MQDLRGQKFDQKFPLDLTIRDVVDASHNPLNQTLPAAAAKQYPKNKA